jgi:hypothetical protein
VVTLAILDYTVSMTGVVVSHHFIDTSNVTNDHMDVRLQQDFILAIKQEEEEG